MEISNKFSENFYELRMEHNVSRADIATIVGVSEATVGFWEREGRKPSFDDLILLSRLFGVTVDYLIGNSDEREDKTKKMNPINKFKNSMYFKEYEEDSELFEINFYNMYSEFFDERTRFITNKHSIKNTLKGKIDEEDYVRLERDFSNLSGTIHYIYGKLMTIRAGHTLIESEKPDPETGMTLTDDLIKLLEPKFPTLELYKFSNEFIHNLYECKS